MFKQAFAFVKVLEPGGNLLIFLKTLKLEVTAPTV